MSPNSATFVKRPIHKALEWYIVYHSMLMPLLRRCTNPIRQSPSELVDSCGCRGAVECEL